MSIWDSNKGKYDPNLERDQLVFLQQRRYTDVQRGNRKFSREMTALDHESGDQEVVRCVCVCRVKKWGSSVNCKSTLHVCVVCCGKGAANCMLAH